jgi:hypothetical protein
MTASIGSRGAGQAGPPTRWASWVVRSAVLPLPSEHRWRYRQEFLAELYGMTPAEQRRHAAGVLSRIWTLRVVLAAPARVTRKEAAMANRGSVASEFTAGAACATPKAAGTTNAAVAGSNAAPPEPIPTPSGRLDPMRAWPHAIWCSSALRRPRAHGKAGNEEDPPW